MSVFLNFYNPKDVRQTTHRGMGTGGDTIDNINYLDEFKQMRVWLCWNYCEKDGKPTKIPCAASGDKTGTNEEYRDTWVTFDEAKAAAQKKHYSGVGFVIPEGYFFLDIDHKPLDDPYVVKKDGRIRDGATTGKIYKVYREWCSDNNGGFAKTAKEFRDTLAAHLGMTYEEMTKRVHGNTYYAGYTLTYETKQQYTKAYGYDNTLDTEDDYG